MKLLENKKKAVKLSWWILEQKLFYYFPQYGKCVDDTVYDKKELIYIKLCKELGIKPTASDSIGFPWDSPSGRLVVSKHCNAFETNRKTVIDFENELEHLEKIKGRKKI